MFQALISERRALTQTKSELKVTEESHRRVTERESQKSHKRESQKVTEYIYSSAAQISTSISRVRKGS